MFSDTRLIRRGHCTGVGVVCVHDERAFNTLINGDLYPNTGLIDTDNLCGRTLYLILCAIYGIKSRERESSDLLDKVTDRWRVGRDIRRKVLPLHIGSVW